MKKLIIYHLFLFAGLNADSFLSFGNYYPAEETIEILYDSDQDIGGFQFHLEGCMIEDVSGGMAEEHEFMTTISDNLIIAFTLNGNAIPSGSGLLTQINLNLVSDDGLICFSNSVVSNAIGHTMPVTVSDCLYVEGFYNLEGGNNLISFPALPNNNSIENIIGNYDNDIHYVIGNGVGLFNTDYDEDGIFDYWSGNLIEISHESGYWFGIHPDSTLGFQIPPGILTPIDFEYELVWGNNLISYIGENNAPVLEAIPQYIQDITKFVIGMGTGIFHHDTDGDGVMDTWSGNLNYFHKGKGYWINLDFLPDDSVYTMSWHSDGNFSRNIDFENKDPFASIPEAFRFTQSTEQAFYLVKDIPEGDEGDLIMAYCNDNLVGSVEWMGEYTPIPVMGKDFSPQTEGFCEVGDIPQFKLIETHNSQLVSLVSSDGNTPGWSSLGVYTLESLTSQSMEIPTEFILHSAYPNPFNPVTTISFGVPSPSPFEERVGAAGVRSENRDVSLTIYDITGKRVKTLLNKPMAPGHHSIQWNAVGQPSGVYFVKLNAGEFESKQKILLVK